MNNKLSLIVGMGKTGESIGRWLDNQKKPFAFYDTRKAPPNQETLSTLFPRADFYCGQLPDDIWASVEMVYLSPGVDLAHEVVTSAARHHCPIGNDIDCLAKEIEGETIVAITGTNGKSTVTDLVGLMAKADGKPVSVAGNIGEPVLDQLAKSSEDALWVLELSSFQLDLSTHLRPTVATILNISPDHLDRHRSFAAYVSAKQTIYQQAKQCLFNREDANTQPKDSEKAMSFGLDQPKNDHEWGIHYQQDIPYLSAGTNLFLSTQALQVKGQHFWLNALAAAALAKQVDISWDAIKNVLCCYTGLPYRTQWVRTLNQVDFINDSKGTNVGATISAIKGIGPTVKGKLILIAGGQGKGADFTLLQNSVDQYIKSAFLYGEDGSKLAKAIEHQTQVYLLHDLEAALHQAYEAASPGDCILFSPACASFDGFKDFNHRGEVFNQLVMNLK